MSRAVPCFSCENRARKRLPRAARHDDQRVTMFSGTARAKVRERRTPPIAIESTALETHWNYGYGYPPV